MPPAASDYVQEHSAGGIVHRRGADGQIEIAIVYRTYHSDWTLPKGHLEGQETAAEAALREVEEEAGLICEIMDHIGHSVYRFYDRKKKQRIEKRVDYFLMSMLKDKGEIQLEEVDEVRWFPFLEAIEKLSFQRDKDLVKLAITRLGAATPITLTEA